MAEDHGGGCLINFLMVFFTALMGTFMGFSVSVPQPADNFNQIYTLSAESSAEDLAIIQEVLTLRLETLLNTGQINAYDPVVITPDGEITVIVAAEALDEDMIITTLTTVGHLEFVDLSTVALNALIEGVAINTLFIGDVPTILTNEDITAATVVDDRLGGYAIQVNFTPEAAEMMGAFTEAHIGQRLAIVMDGVVLSAPSMQGRVDTSAWISGNFTEAEAQAIAVQVGTAPLPVPLELVSVEAE